jgi:F-box domain
MEQLEKSWRGNRDIISSLPDHVLHLIMSSLKAQEVLKLRLLSKRWENLWTTLPFLNFDMSTFYSDIVSNDYYIDVFGRFQHFVNMCLLRREALSLHTFYLYCAPPLDFYYGMVTKSWLLYAIQHNPRVLDFTITGVGSLPPGVFSCSSLVDLSLSAYGFVNNVECVNLPILRRLHLQAIFVNQNFLEKLFCGCPVLEYFHLQRCFVMFSSIHSQSLKHLKLEANIRCTDKIMDSINAPKLLSFYYGCANYDECKILLNMPSLSSASICVDYRLDNLFYDGKSYILSGISSVKHLELNGPGILVCA